MEALSNVELIKVLEAIEEKMDSLREGGYFVADNSWIHPYMEDEYKILESIHKKFLDEYNRV